MKVLLLTLTTILAVTSDQEFDDAYYKRLEPGYSYGYLQTPPTQQFSTVSSVLECAGIALNSQSEFFTYNNVSHVCKNYSPKNIMTVVSANDSNDISFYRNSQWIKAYALSMGAGSKVYDSFNNIGSPSSWNVDECRGSFCPNFFRHTILDFWDHLSVDEVKLVIYKNKTAVVNMVFNGRNTNLRNWFSREKLKSSPWSDLPAAGVNLFAMNRFHQRRNFYISSLHNGCEADKGWLYVLEIAHCEFEKRIPLPVIIYSGDNSRIRWNNNFEKADSMAIFIRLEE